MPLSRRTDGMPQPPWLPFLAHETPHLIELCAQPAALGQFVSPADLDLDLLWGQMLQHGLIYLLEVRFFFFNSFRTVVGLTCNTRAVSRMLLAFRAISTICRLMSGDCPA